MNDETVWVPRVVEARFTPNPAGTTDAVLLQVQILDVFGSEQVEAWPSGELMAGGM